MDARGAAELVERLHGEAQAAEDALLRAAGASVRAAEALERCPTDLAVAGTSAGAVVVAREALSALDACESVLGAEGGLERLRFEVEAMVCMIHPLEERVEAAVRLAESRARSAQGREGQHKAVASQVAEGWLDWLTGLRT